MTLPSVLLLKPYLPLAPARAFGGSRKGFLSQPCFFFSDFLPLELLWVMSQGSHLIHALLSTCLLATRPLGEPWWSWHHLHPAHPTKNPHGDKGGWCTVASRKANHDHVKGLKRLVWSGWGGLLLHQVFHQGEKTTVLSRAAFWQGPHPLGPREDGAEGAWATTAPPTSTEPSRARGTGAVGKREDDAFVK